MRRILAAALLAATALSGTSYGSTEGCVTQYFLGPGDDVESEPILVQRPDGSYEVNPPSVRIPAPVPTVLAVVAHVNGFVGCVV